MSGRTPIVRELLGSTLFHFIRWPYGGLVLLDRVLFAETAVDTEAAQLVDGEKMLVDGVGDLSVNDAVMVVKDADRAVCIHEGLDGLRELVFKGIDFLNRNGRYDNWFLQIETFDPHEPFTSPTSHFDPDCATQPDWPPYADVTEGPEEIEAIRTKYEASVRFCDRQLGRVLDLMDELDLWKDTMLIVNTDHGFFLSEHGYWGKGGSPNYEELVHTPLFIWDPRSGRKGVHSPALVQTIDLAPTVLDYFGIEIPADMLGRPLTQTLADDTPVREYALFGYHSMPVGITDGRYTLLRDVKDFDEKTYEYTQMPTHMRAMFSVEEMRTATMAPGFSYTKGTPVMKIEARPNPRFLHTLKGGDMLFDLQNDPHQEHVLEDAEQSDRLLTAMTAAFEENDAPEEMYSRYGLSSTGRRRNK